jgi:hypothetical protein
LKGDGMDWQFGYNCAHFIPTLDKCGVKVDRYNKRADLLADRWIKTREILAYTGWSLQDLMDRVERGEVHAKKIAKPKNPERDGYVRYRLRCSWEWDSCGMAVTGGTCEFYEPTDAAHITCIADLQHWDAQHPNRVKVPSDEDVELIEGQLSGLVVEEERPPAVA